MAIDCILQKTLSLSPLFFLVAPLLGMANVTLHTAARQNRTQVVEKLLNEGADVNEKDEKGFTALHWAAKNGHIAIVRLLIARNANSTITDKKFKTALDKAKKNAHKEIIALLQGQDRTLKDDEEEIDSFSRTSPERIPQPPPMPDINRTDKTGETALFKAIAGGDKETAVRLLACGANPNIPTSSKDTPLLRAAKEGDKNTDLVARLLRAGANPSCKDERGRTPLHFVAKLGDKAYAVGDLLVKQGARCTQPSDDTNDTPFKIVWKKIDYGQFPSVSKMFRLFLLYGANSAENSSNASDAKSYLETAVTIKEHGYAAAAVMIECGANPAKLGKQALGMILFHLIEARENATHLVREALQAGAQHYLTDQDGCTPLLKAAQLGSEGYEIVIALLEDGADMAVCTPIDKKTALHYAVEKKCLRTVQLLCKKGADATKPDLVGMSPLNYADAPGCEDIKEYLREHRKRPQRAPKKVNDLQALPPIDINLQDDLFRTVSSNNPSVERVKELLKNHADPLVRNGKGETSFLLLALRGTDYLPHLRACLFYLKTYKSVDVLQKTLNETLIKVVCSDDLVKVADFLIESGANVHAVNVAGETALYCAIVTKAKKNVELLITREADPYQKVPLTNKSVFDDCNVFMKSYVKKLFKQKQKL